LEFLKGNLEFFWNLEIWNFFGKLSFFLDAQGIILVYDITKKKTLEGLEDWMQDVNDKGDKNVIKCVCGNKVDLIEYQEVDLMEGENFARVKISIFSKFFFLAFLTIF